MPAIECPSLVRGVVLRATRLDPCGRPMYGDCNQVVSKGFISVQMSPQTEEGESISVTNAAGETCVSEAPCTQISGIGTTIEFCAVDPDLVGIMNPTYTPVLDWAGNTIGYDTPGRLTCDRGFALEVWTGVARTDNACAGGGGQGSWGYLLLPWVIGGAEGDLTVGNSALTFTFSGRTKLGHGWRRGPYAVQAGEGDVPSPLLQPILPDKHRRFFVTSIRPPEPECGCQPVDRPTPDPADLEVTGMPGESPRRTVRLRADNHGFGPVVINWGDGSAPQEAQDGAWVTHTYTTDGEYTISVADKETPVVITTRDITVPLPADDPTVTLTGPDPDNRYVVAATVTLPPQAARTATLDWGDGSDVQEVTVGEDGTVTVLHTYTVPGVYTVTVRRGDIDTYRGRAAIRVPVTEAPDATVAVDPEDTAGMSVILTYDNAGRGPVSITWGAGGTPQQAEETGTASHTYAQPGDYVIRVQSLGDAAASTEVPVTVPMDLPAEPLTVTVTGDNSDPTGMTVVATVDNNGQGPVTVAWGDGQEDAGVTGSATHTYTAAGTYTVTATDEDDPARTGSAEVTVPVEVEQPAPQVTLAQDPDDATGMTVTATVDNGLFGPVGIAWGDGEESTDVPGDGTVSHQYAEEGTYTVTVTDEDNAEAPAGTATVTVPVGG